MSKSKLTTCTQLIQKTILKRIEYEIEKRKSSRFLAMAWPFKNEKIGLQMELKQIIEERKIKYPDACHHCYAYRTFDGIEKYSDDGEPHNTAGKPILVALQRAQLVNVGIVVSRIFGGTKLGTGGLIHAYGAAAMEVLEQATILERIPSQNIHIETPYVFVDVLKQAVDKFQCEILSQEFSTEIPSFEVRVPIVQFDFFCHFLKSKSAGSIQIETTE
jgi:uncharacterized YigZ family protein